MVNFFQVLQPRELYICHKFVIKVVRLPVCTVAIITIIIDVKLSGMEEERLLPPNGIHNYSYVSGNNNKPAFRGKSRQRETRECNPPRGFIPDQSAPMAGYEDIRLPLLSDREPRNHHPHSALNFGSIFASEQPLQIPDKVEMPKRPCFSHVLQRGFKYF